MKSPPPCLRSCRRLEGAVRGEGHSGGYTITPSEIRDQIPRGCPSQLRGPGPVASRSRSEATLMVVSVLSQVYLQVTVRRLATITPDDLVGDPASRRRAAVLLGFRLTAGPGRSAVAPARTPPAKQGDHRGRTQPRCDGAVPYRGSTGRQAEYGLASPGHITETSKNPNLSSSSSPAVALAWSKSRLHRTGNHYLESPLVSLQDRGRPLPLPRRLPPPSG